MRKITLMVSVGLAIVLPAVAYPKHTATAATPHVAPTGHIARRHCPRRFTVRMDLRAASAVYRGTRRVTMSNLKLLGYLERCQRNPAAQPYARWRNRRAARRHESRIKAHIEVTPRAGMGHGVASWYDDGGTTASGFHAYYGVAVCGTSGPCVPFGTRIEFCYHGRCVVAIADDHGPYVIGRNFDLNQNTAAALGFGGVDTVTYAIG